MDIEKIISNWVQKNTVPYNTPFSKETVKIFTSHREGQNLDNMFGCRFIVYNDKRRIILNNKNQHKYEFYLISCDSHYDYYMPSIRPLVYDIFEISYVESDTYNDDEIRIKIDRLKEIEKHFHINFNINYDRYDDDYIYWEGNHWDYDAEEDFKNSDVFKIFKEALGKYLQYEYAPYRKYNPDFDPFKYDKPNESFNKIFKVLTKEQIINILTAPYHDGKAILEGESNMEYLTKLLNMLDITAIKLFILSRKHFHKETFVRACNTFYNL